MFAQLFARMEFGETIIGLLIFAAVIAIALIIVRAMGIGIPPWFIQIAWVIVALLVGILAIRFVMTL